MSSSAALFLHLALSQLVFCFLALIPLWRDNPTSRLFSLLILCGIGYHLSSVFGPFTSMSFIWWVDYLAGNLLPGVFWLTSLSIFADQQKIKPWQYALATLPLAIPTVSTLLQVIFQFDIRQFPAFYGLVTYGAMTIELAIIGHAWFAAMRHFKSDLVEERRVIRGIIIALTGMYLLLVIVLEQLFQVTALWLSTVEYAALALLMFTINLVLFSVRRDTLFEKHLITIDTTEPEQAYSPEVQRIIDAMEVEKLYQQEGMTISALSSHLGIHEYRLRQLINGELNYRNFNDFLNFFRIRDVADNLSDHERARIPVLTLALESGFRSLSSFNKAFKNKHGVTPTEFRATALSQSKKL
ncbi:helix-turn-helix domain-containing protein [Aestuariibacter sp. AA17]|uniref:Helix-turn-helix domain-containing protein n=1 Tax=Fluctibacter corallii TaxID=2984329 RepID=A0ABT3A6V7_9ALTE|nr:helix-turn-helix domain-containing protein [Aestuariibacter sp. AA17]MCV2884086.1 helix-turn-helix domain-containing protein [Aestuariibacter sp. AA17]